MYHGNPFNLKAVVDKWPDFSTVVACPQEQEMTDNFDHYTNTYLIYSKDLNKCQEFLATSDIINWKQHLQIQSKNVAWLLGLLLLTSVRSFFILVTLSPDI